MAQRTFLVTGGGRDIGRGIGEALGTAGGFGIVHHAHSGHGAAATVARIREVGGEAVAIQADLADETGARTLVTRTLEVLGERRLDVLVLNAADTAAVPLGGADPGTMRRMLTVNVLAPALILDGLANRLSDSASVIALSVAAVRQVFSPDLAFFAATKAAADTLVRGWAVALGPRGVRVNAVAPGVVEANFRAELLKDDAFRSALEGQTALGRVGQIDDVVDVVAFLASDRARWITGQTIDVSGGWRL